MVDVTISFKIPSVKVSEYVAHYVYLHKNTEMEEDEETPKYTDNQWVKEHIIRTVRSQIIRGRNSKYRNDITAYNAEDVK